MGYAMTTLQTPNSKLQTLNCKLQTPNFLMQYLLESAFCLALLYTFYLVVLRRETFFQLNRAYLMLAPLVALTVPALNLKLTKPAPQEAVSTISVSAAQPNLPNHTWVALVENMSAAPAGIEQVWEKPLFNLTLGEVSWWVYLAVASVLVLRLLVQLARMLIFLRRCRLEKSGDVVLATGPQNTPLASFFGFVFWHPGSADNHEQRLMLDHEMVHVRQWHSMDILCIELLIALQWFNPLLHLYRRSLREVHEYIADEQVVRKTGSAYTYAKLLAHSHVSRTAVDVRPVLVNTFHSELKKRLIMLAQQPTPPAQRFKMLLVLPVLVFLMSLFSFRLVEEIPAARELVQTMESYQQHLAEVVIAAEKPAEPLPYTLYWGALQIKLELNPVTGQYAGEAFVSPEVFREAVKREPRMWNGKSLEQHLSLHVNGLEVRSDYYNEEVYLACKSKLVEHTAALSEEDMVTLTLELPGNLKAVMRVGLGELSPDWIKQKDGQQTNWGDDPLGMFFDFGPLLQSVLWDKRDMTTKTAVSEKTFWELMQTPPVMVFTDGSKETVTQNLALWLIDGEGIVLSRVPEGPSGLDWQGMADKLESLRDKLKPGVKAGIYRIFTAEERKSGDETRSRLLLALTIVEEINPLLFVNRNDKSNYQLMWGDYSRRFTNTYGMSFWDGVSQESRMYTYAPSTAHPWYMSKKDFERLLKEKPAFNHEDSLVNSFTFNLVHNGKTYIYHPDKTYNKDFIEIPSNLRFERLATEVQNGDVIRLEGMTANKHPYRHVVVPQSLLKTFDETLIITEYNAIDVAHDKGPVRLTLSTKEAKRLQGEWKGKSGAWFQYGDIDLSLATQDIIIRDDPPKAPLPSATAAIGSMKLSVSPNPMRENAAITLVSSATGAGYLNIADAAGRVAYRQKVTYDRAGEPVTYVVQRDDLTVPGMYVVTVELGRKVASCKLVVE